MSENPSSDPTPGDRIEPGPPAPGTGDAPAYRDIPPAPPAPESDAPASPASTSPAADAPAPGYAAPGYSTPGYSAPGYAAPGAPAPQYPAPGYSAAAYGAPAYGAAAPARTNVLAILSLVASIAGLLLILPVIGPLAAVIMGHISLRQIARTGEKGRGMALTGTILGWVGVAFLVLLLILLIVGLSIAASNSAGFSA